MKPSTNGIIGLALILGLAVAAQAEDLEAKGLQIASAADAQDAGFHDFTVHGVMTLRDSTGTVGVRDFTQQVMEVAQDGDKSLVVFHRPPDVAGTALLTYAHVLVDDDQWLYLPALKRVKRISSANRSGPFVGSEFAYEDISSQEVDDFRHVWVRDEPCPNSASALTCHVVDRFPRYEGSGYVRQRVWLDDSQYRIYRIEYYDRKDSHLKTLNAEGYERYKDRFWRSKRLLMENHESGKATEIVWSDYVFRTGLQDTDFSSRALERGR